MRLVGVPTRLLRLENVTVVDRRATIRFEIVGRLPGTITAQRDVVLHNISLGGALIEISWPVKADSLLVLHLESHTHHASVEARVCRVIPASLSSDERFLVGLAFTDVAAEQLMRLISSVAS